MCSRSALYFAESGTYTVIATGYPPVATQVQLGVGTRLETVITLRPATLADAGGLRTRDAASRGTGSPHPEARTVAMITQTK